MAIVRGYWVLVLGVVLVIAGVVAEIPIWQITSGASFGWTAYAPLTSTTFTPTLAPVLPWVTIAAGVGLIAGWIGFRIGRSRAKNPGN